MTIDTEAVAVIKLAVESEDVEGKHHVQMCPNMTTGLTTAVTDVWCSLHNHLLRKCHPHIMILKPDRVKPEYRGTDRPSEILKAWIN